MGDRNIRVMLGISTAILTVGVLYFARSVVAPVAVALFVIALVWPLQAALQTRIPKLLAMAITLVVTIAVVAALGYMVVWGFSQAWKWLVANAARFQGLYDEAATWLEGHGLYTAGMLAEFFNVSWLIRIFQRLATWLQSMIVFSAVTFVFVMLGLLEVDIIQCKLAGAEGGATGARLL